MGSSPAPVPEVSSLEAFWRACRFEWRHLAGLRSTWILFGMIGLLSMASGVLMLWFLKPGEAVASADLESSLTWSPMVAQICSIGFYLMVLGTGPVSAELVRGSARTTWLTVGGRSIAYWAKCAVGVAVGVVVALAGAILECAVAAVAIAVKGADQPTWPDLAAPVGRLLLWVACWMLLCTAVSVLIRNRVGPVLVLCLVPLIGERAAAFALNKVPGVDLGWVGDVMPFAAGRTMMVDPGGMSQEERELFGMFMGSDLPMTAGGVVFVAWTVVVVGAGFVSYQRRAA